MTTNESSEPQNEETAAERWRQWQRKNAVTDAKDARRMLIVFTTLFAALGVWLGIQLLVPSPLP